MTSSVLQPRLAVAPIARGREAWLLVMVLLAIVALHALLLRPGHEWSDDFAMYVAHALNLLAGHPYGDTGYITNPWAVPGPATYPPVYPLAILPAIAAWGPDLQVLKVLGVAMLGGALAFAYAVFRPRVGFTPALTGLVLIGVCPYLIAFGNEVRSDSLFLCLFFFTLWLGERWTGIRRPWGARCLAQGLALGFVGYLAYGTRSVGMVLLPALLATEVWRLRRVGPVLAVALPTWLALGVLQSLTLHSDGGYASLVTLDPHTVVYNTKSYLASLSLLWSNGLPRPWGFGLRAALFATVSVLACIGYLANLRRGVTVLEVIPVFYLAPLVVYWVGTMIQQRYMLPLFPIYLYHAWSGCGVVRRRLGPAPTSWLLVLLGAGTTMAYASALATAPRGDIRPGITDANSQAVLRYVRDATPTSAVLLVGRARAFPLYTQRRAASPYGFRTDAELWGEIREHGVTHLVVGLGPLAKEMDYEHPDDLARFVAANPAAFRETFRNGSFVVFAVERAAAEAKAR